MEIKFVILSGIFMLLWNLCSAKTSQDPVYFVAKCGYECWPKYGDTKSKESSNSLNDFEAGELRGCMEYCVRREMDNAYPEFGTNEVKSNERNEQQSESNGKSEEPKPGAAPLKSPGAAGGGTTKAPKKNKNFQPVPKLDNAGRDLRNNQELGLNSQ